jgi:enoyl-CoA hydratase
VSGVRVDVDGAVAVVTLDEADTRNALTHALVDAMVEAFDRVDGDERVRAVVVTGAGRAFCAGADLSTLGGSRDEGVRSIYDAFLRVARSPLPTIAAVNGAAVGAGMNLALCCDVRLAARGARFDTRFLQLGIHPGGGHTWLLHRAVGPQAAAAAVLFGEVLDADAAHRTGLVWDVVDDGVVDAAVALGQRLAAVPRELVVRTKASLRAAPAITEHDDAVELELGRQAWSMQQPEFAERLAQLRSQISGR